MCSSIGRLSDSVTGAPAMEDLEAQRAGRRLERPVEAHRERLLVAQLRHHLDVGHGGARRELLAVACRKRIAELAQQSRCRAPRPTLRSARL